MANQRLVELLGQYTGETDSLNAFVAAAEQELGADWTQTIYADMGDVSDDIKERLDHAFNYYAATTAWNELQSYLIQEAPLDYHGTLERIPVLEHWLSFFGAAGEEAVTQLKEKLRVQGAATHQSTKTLDNPFEQDIGYETPISDSTRVRPEQIEAIFSDDVPISAEKSADIDTTQPVLPIVEPSQSENISEPSAVFSENAMPSDDTERPILSEMTIAEETTAVSDTNEQTILDGAEVDRPVSGTEPQYNRADVFDPIEAQRPAQNDTPLQSESEEVWRVRRMFRQIDFVTNVQSWISFLCLELGYTDFYTYRHYGFLVDVLDKTIFELKDMLSQSDLYEVMNTVRPNGVKQLQDKLIAYEQQAQEGHEMLSDYEPLTPLSVDDLKNKLGAMDLSGEKEYLGPAPDGFEMIDDPYENMNDDDLKKEYEKIEAKGNLQTDMSAQSAVGTEQSVGTQEKQPGAIKNTSQTSQNGVQRKMSFTFGVKPAGQSKPSGDVS